MAKATKTEHLRVVENDAPPPPQGHNEATNLPVDKDESKYVWLRDQIVQAEGARDLTKVADDNARALVKKARKTFESHGGSLAEFDLARELSGMENPDAARARLVRLISYLGFEGLELPEGIEKAAAVDPYHSMPPSERQKSFWFEKGYIAALSGKDIVSSAPPKDVPMDNYQDWANGVVAGDDERKKLIAQAGPLFAESAVAGAVEGMQVDGEGGEGGEDLRPGFLKDKTEEREAEEGESESETDSETDDAPEDDDTND